MSGVAQRGPKGLSKARQRIRKLEHDLDELAKTRDAMGVALTAAQARRFEMLNERNQTMSKRGFEILAAAVRESVVLEPAFAEEDPEGWRDARERFAEELADALEVTNMNFDRDRFLKEATS